MLEVSDLKFNKRNILHQGPPDIVFWGVSTTCHYLIMTLMQTEVSEQPLDGLHGLKLQTFLAINPSDFSLQTPAGKVISTSPYLLNGITWNESMNCNQFSDP